MNSQPIDSMVLTTSLSGVSGIIEPRDGSRGLNLSASALQDYNKSSKEGLTSSIESVTKGRE